MAIVGSGLDLQLSFPELDNRACVSAVTDVDEGNAAGLLLCAGKIKLRDAVSEGGGGGVVDETEDLEASDLSSVDQSPALGIGEPGRHAHDEVGDRKLKLGGGNLLDLAEEHGSELCGIELLLLAEVGDLGADLAIAVDEGRRDELLLDLDIGVLQFPTD